jgi:DNA modification methylase
MSPRPITHNTSEARQLAFDELYSSAVTIEQLGIDHAFPERFADELSRWEAFNKHLYRPNTYLHKWWARRCGSTFRAILKQLSPDPARRDYYAPGGLAGKVVLDPMMGGGTTLHEAIRLGASVIGVDVDPIPVAQARATLSQIPLAELQEAFDRFFAALYRELKPYFQTTCPHCARSLDLQYTLYGLRRMCACGEVVQIDQYELRYEGERVIRISPETGQIEDGSDRRPGSSERATEVTATIAKPGSGTTGSDVAQDAILRYRANHLPLVLKSETTCLHCGEKYRDLLDAPFYARYAPLVVVADCPEHGLFFKSPDVNDLARRAAADERRVGLDFGDPAHFAVRNGPKSGDLLNRNVTCYLDLFSSRQLLYLHHAIRFLQAEEGVVKFNLALLVSTSLEFNAMLCGYKGWFKHRPGAIRHVFGLHAYSFQYTALENNPINPCESSGNLQQLFRDRIVRGRRWAVAPIERLVEPGGRTRPVQVPGELDGGREVFSQAQLTEHGQAFWLLHRDARHLPIANDSVDFVVTDPPYYDSVQYSDLAAFFRVWLAQLLPGEVDWAYEEAQSAVATKAADGDTSFMVVLAGIFRECGRVLKPGVGRMVFTFHHWDPNAWAELTLALREAGFRLINRYVVFSENPISVHIANLNSIKHDAILVLALKEEVSPDRWQPLECIDTGDSETFCRQCGAALGWLLAENAPPAEVRAIWKALIQREGSNGKKSG